MNDVIKIFKLIDFKQKKYLFFLFLLSLLVVVAEAISLTMILPLITILINPNYIENIDTEKGSLLNILFEKLLTISNQFGTNDILTVVMLLFVFIILIKNIIVYIHFSKINYFIHQFEKNLSK